MKKIIFFTVVFAAMGSLAHANDFTDQMALCSQYEGPDPEGANPYEDVIDSLFPQPLWEEEEAPSCGMLEHTSLGSSEGAPVWNTFMRNLGGCAPGCQPVGHNAYRSGRGSCHNTGRALDVPSIRCGNRTFRAINGGRFAEIVSCMKRKMIVLYRNGPGVTSGHHDHAHFSLGCSIAGHANYW